MHDDHRHYGPTIKLGLTASRVVVTFVGLFTLCGSLVAFAIAATFIAVGLPFSIFAIVPVLMGVFFIGFGIWIVVVANSKKAAEAHGRIFETEKAPDAQRQNVGNPSVGSPDWNCPNCSAALTEDNEISPSGDVKCLHCESWYNVNRA